MKLTRRDSKTFSRHTVGQGTQRQVDPPGDVCVSQTFKVRLSRTEHNSCAVDGLRGRGACGCCAPPWRSDSIKAGASQRLRDLHVNTPAALCPFCFTNRRLYNGPIWTHTHAHNRRLGGPRGLWREQQAHSMPPEHRHHFTCSRVTPFCPTVRLHHQRKKDQKSVQSFPSILLVGHKFRSKSELLSEPVAPAGGVMQAGIKQQ